MKLLTPQEAISQKEFTLAYNKVIERANGWLAVWSDMDMKHQTIWVENRHLMEKLNSDLASLGWNCSTYEALAWAYPYKTEYCVVVMNPFNKTGSD